MDWAKHGRTSLHDPNTMGSSLPTGAAKDAVVVLGQRIVNDVYLPGDVMPTEPELADSLGVSRTTVRDAIKVLSGKGMVRTARRYGTRVRPVEDWNLLDADVVSWHQPSNKRIARMFVETTELRCIIEPAAAALAAKRAKPEQVQIILEAAHAMHPGSGDVDELFAADCLFHSTVLDATNNLMMRQLQPIFRSILRISYEFGVQIVDGKTPSRAGHILVADAIRDGDSEKARSEMDLMLEGNRMTSAEYWQRHNDTSNAD
ncbi:FadR/GntR family transcriptional regulator [Celeribacter sp.]|uniref:FadR/GntR family transcriptional regulator n=1 Tax=Celeribacter sp. TaxID=1890673 RepID=UPI003A8E3AC3